MIPAKEFHERITRDQQRSFLGIGRECEAMKDIHIMIEVASFLDRTDYYARDVLTIADVQAIIRWAIDADRLEIIPLGDVVINCDWILEEVLRVMAISDSLRFISCPIYYHSVDETLTLMEFMETAFTPDQITDFRNEHDVTPSLILRLVAARLEE